MEGAGIALAVIPLVVEIFKSYRTVRDRFRAFAHADDVLRELMLIYHLAMDSFRNECELLLSNAVYDNEILAAMMVDPEHAAWQDPQLEPRLCAFLDSNNETFRRTFIWIKDRLNNAERELERLYDEPGTEETRGFLRGAKDAKLAFTISRKESSDRVLLDEIDEWLKKIRRLRKQRCELRDASSALASTPRPAYESVPSEYDEIRRASRELHRFLQSALSPGPSIPCKEYRASLALGSEHTKVEAARLRIAIVDTMSTIAKQRDNEPEPPIWLHVQSYETSASSLVERPTKKMRIGGDLSSHTHQSSNTSAASTTMVHRAVVPALRPPGARGSCAFHEPTLDKSACGSYMGCTTCMSPNASLRLCFYDNSKNAVLQQSLPVMSEESKPVTNMLQGLRSELEQLILAHRIAIATLQYHSSPWLGEDWNLEDIFHFDAWAHQDHDSFEKRSKSLHFNARFLATTTSSLRQAEKAEKEEKFRLHEVIGKTNIPLAKLGVALLQICYKTDKYNVNSSGQHAIITARETLEYPPRPPSYLGRQWLDMAQKCVDCDFSVGTNLDSVALQAAVYHQIICVLDSKIVPLKGFMNEIAEPIV